MFTRSSLSEDKIAKYSNDYCDVFNYALYKELSSEVKGLKFAVVTTDERNWVFMLLDDNGTYISAGGWGDEHHFLCNEPYSDMFDEDELDNGGEVHIHSFPLVRLNDYSFIKGTDIKANIVADAKLVAAEYLKR